MTDNIILVNSINKKFGDRLVLENLDFAIPKGESVVIIGCSGSGKSVLLKSILGLIPIDSGNIVFDSKNYGRSPIVQDSDFTDRFGMLFQGCGLFDSLRIWENICFKFLNFQRLKKPKDELLRIAYEKLEMVGLDSSVANLYPDELSGGMKKRVGIARAIATKPEILFFDEPTSGLDLISSSKISELIKKLHSELGATIVTITHDIARCADILGSKIAMIHGGKIIWNGSKDNLHTTDNPYIKQFINGNTDGPID